MNSLISAALLAASALQQPTAATCDADVYRQFDFWLGSWDVTTLDGKHAGTNEITSAENGCLIIERWQSVSGGTGQSYNYYDPGAGKWRQIWVSQAATIDYAGGLNDAGEMVLKGTIAYRGGNTAPFRGVWTPEADGTVRQHFEQYDASREAWGPWFTGLYTRK